MLISARSFIVFVRAHKYSARFQNKLRAFETHLLPPMYLLPSKFKQVLFETIYLIKCHNYDNSDRVVYSFQNVKKTNETDVQFTGR